MPTSIYNRPSRGKGIPADVKARTERRILEYARLHCAEKFSRIDVRFRGSLCYIDAYTPWNLPGEPKPSESEMPVHLCRLGYCGSEDRWTFAFYTYAQERYEPSFLMSGEHQGTPEEAFETSTLFY